MSAHTTPALPTEEECYEAAGKIAAYAAMSLHESFPDLDLDGLVETFTRPTAVRMLASRYLGGAARGLTAGEAAAEAGTVLMRAWAEARLQARAVKLTPARRWALRAIDRMDIKLRQDGRGLWLDTLHVLDVPRRDTVEWAVGQGLARLDTSTSLRDGQTVTLTEAGIAALDL